MIFDNSEFTKELNEKLHNKAHGGVVSFVTDTVWGVGACRRMKKVRKISMHSKPRPLKTFDSYVRQRGASAAVCKKHSHKSP